MCGFNLIKYDVPHILINTSAFFHHPLQNKLINQSKSSTYNEVNERLQVVLGYQGRSLQ